MKFLVLFLLISASTYSQLPLQKKAMLLKRVIQKNHYSPRAVNDSFSANLYDHIIKELDEYKLYFTQQDVAKLNTYRLLLDDELDGKKWGFIIQI